MPQFVVIDIGDANMAGLKNIKHFLLIFIINIYFICISSGLQCYNGTVTTGPTVEKIKCPSLKLKEIHKRSTTNSSDHQEDNTTTAPAKLPSTSVPKTANYCSIFKHISSSSSLTFHQHHQSYVSFSCDNKNVCDGKPVNKFTKVNLGNVNGELYCCNTSLCNVPQLPSPLPKQALKCYHAKNPGSGIVVGCQHGNGLCASTTEFQHDGVRQQFFCDTKHLCAQANITTTNCNNITLNNKTRVRICCCSQNYCNKPPWNITENSTNINGTHPPAQASKPFVDWLFIGGLIALLLLMAGLIVGAVVIVKRYKGKQPGGDLRLSYRRLRADRLEESEPSDNVQLVIT